MLTTTFLIIAGFALMFYLMFTYVKRKGQTNLTTGDKVIFITSRPDLGQDGEITTTALNFPLHARIMRLPRTKIFKIVYLRCGEIYGVYSKDEYKEMREEILRLNNKKLTQWPTKI